MLALLFLPFTLCLKILGVISFFGVGGVALLAKNELIEKVVFDFY
jgi:hypothetical protein